MLQLAQLVKLVQGRLKMGFVLKIGKMFLTPPLVLLVLLAVFFKPEYKLWFVNLVNSLWGDPILWVIALFVLGLVFYFWGILSWFRNIILLITVLFVGVTTMGVGLIFFIVMIAIGVLINPNKEVDPFSVGCVPSTFFQLAILILIIINF